MLQSIMTTALASPLATALIIILAVVAALVLFAESSFGRTVIKTIGKRISVVASPPTLWKAGGITIDWSTVTAVAVETTLEDGTVVAIGDKYLRYGTVLDLIGTSEVQTVDLSGDDDPTGGTWTLTLVNPITGETAALTGLAYNITAAALLAAIIATDAFDTGDLTISLAGFVYTITFAARFGNVAAATTDNGAGLTGGVGDTFAITVTTTTAGAGSGMYGPVDTGASDGRAAMARGETYILPETVLASELGSKHVNALEGGQVWRQRLLVGGSLQPTLANLLTAMPLLQLVQE